MCLLQKCKMMSLAVKYTIHCAKNTYSDSLPTFLLTKIKTKPVLLFCILHNGTSTCIHIAVWILWMCAYPYTMQLCPMINTAPNFAHRITTIRHTEANIKFSLDVVSCIYIRLYMKRRPHTLHWKSQIIKKYLNLQPWIVSVSQHIIPAMCY